MDNSRKAGLGILPLLAGLVVTICWIIPPIPQPQSYHLFADQRSFLGIPNFGDVVSNLPFAVIGIWGLVFLRRSRFNRSGGLHVDGREIWPYLFFFGGLVLTAIGSTYYHLAPGNWRLVWDRLPLSMTLMSMVAAVIAERIHPRLGLWLLPILLLAAFASVLQWYWSETRDAGDLRFYVALQAFSVLVILLALFFPARYTRGSDLGLVVGFYALAKGLELLDVPIFTELHCVSGHTLKHIAAAASGLVILRMLQKRRPITASSLTRGEVITQQMPAGETSTRPARSSHRA
jgi:predicted membrane channel-forming protein YqfA (hemolysin III family)